MPYRDPEKLDAYRAKYSKSDKARETRRIVNRRRSGAVNPSGARMVGPCQICGRESDPLQYDHDHKTGVFRGWLCRGCNTGLGAFLDSPALLARAAQYLEAALSSAR